MSSVLGPLGNFDGNSNNNDSQQQQNQQQHQSSHQQNYQPQQQQQQQPRGPGNFLAPPGVGGSFMSQNPQSFIRPNHQQNQYQQHQQQNDENYNQQQQQAQRQRHEQSPAPSHPTGNQYPQQSRSTTEQGGAPFTPSRGAVSFQTQSDQERYATTNPNQNQQESTNSSSQQNYTQQALHALREQNQELEQKKQMLAASSSSNQYQNQNQNQNQPQQQLHIPSEVLFANERPGMRPIPESAFMISGFSQGHPHQHHSGQRERSYSVEAAHQQAQNVLSPFTQRLAKKMNQQIPFEKLPDHPYNEEEIFGSDHHQHQHHQDPHQAMMMAMMGGDQDGSHHYQNSGGGVLGALRDTSVMSGTTSTRGHNTPGGRRGQSPSVIRSRYSQSLGRSHSGRSVSTKMRIGNFVVDFPEATGDLSKRLQMGVAARREEINRRQLSKLHRPTAAGVLHAQAFSNPLRDDIEPLPQEPGHSESIYRRPAPLVHTTSVTRNRTPLRTMTRQDWEDNRRQQAFSQELRRHSAEVSKRSMSRNAAPYVNKHRGTDHTYLSEGAKWFTKSSPRIGHPCRITLASNEYGPSPGPGSYHVPSSFLGR